MMEAMLSKLITLIVFENICSKYSSIDEFISYINDLNTELENKQ